MALIINAHIHAAPGQHKTVKAELEKLVPPTRKEAGCHTYDLHIDKADETHFIFYEIWESKALMDAHMASDHIAAFRDATAGKLADFKLYEMEKLD